MTTHPESQLALTLSAWATGIAATAGRCLPCADRVLLESQASASTPTGLTIDSVPADPTRPVIVRDDSTLRELAEGVAAAAEVAIDLETSSLDYRGGEIVGLGIGLPVGVYYVPVAHRAPADRSLRPDQLALHYVLRHLKLEQRPLVAHNAKFELHWLRHHGAITCCVGWDTMLAARLLRSDQSAELKEVVKRELDVPDWSLTKDEMKQVALLPIDKVARYCAKDVYYTHQLAMWQRQCLAP
jgi:DNA polymerase I-like protein with 3'-5' exonuclease and polymerase domains